MITWAESFNYFNHFNLRRLACGLMYGLSWKRFHLHVRRKPFRVGGLCRSHCTSDSQAVRCSVSSLVFCLAVLVIIQSPHVIVRLPFSFHPVGICCVCFTALVFGAYMPIIAVSRWVDTFIKGFVCLTAAFGLKSDSIGCRQLPFSCYLYGIAFLILLFFNPFLSLGVSRVSYRLDIIWSVYF